MLSAMIKLSSAGHFCIEFSQMAIQVFQFNSWKMYVVTITSFFSKTDFQGFNYHFKKLCLKILHYDFQMKHFIKTTTSALTYPDLQVNSYPPSPILLHSLQDKFMHLSSTDTQTVSLPYGNENGLLKMPSSDNQIIKQLIHNKIQQ